MTSRSSVLRRRSAVRARSISTPDHSHQWATPCASWELALDAEFAALLFNTSLEPHFFILRYGVFIIEIIKVPLCFPSQGGLFNYSNEFNTSAPKILMPTFWHPCRRGKVTRMHIAIHGCLENFEICPYGGFCLTCSMSMFQMNLTEPQHFSNEWDAKNFVQRYFRDSYDISRLRNALATELFDLAWRTDDSIIDETACRLVYRRWRVVSPAKHVSAPISRGSGVAGARLSSSPARVISDVLAPRIVQRAAPARAPAEAAPAPSPEWYAQTSQIAQAKTMEQAARHGSPLYCIRFQAPKRPSTSV